MKPFTVANSNFSTRFIKRNYLVKPSQTQHYRFFKNLPLLSFWELYSAKISQKSPKSNTVGSHLSIQMCVKGIHLT